MGLMAQIHPLQILLASLSGWMNRKQGEVVHRSSEAASDDSVG